jgi:hypothetical protein
VEVGEWEKAMMRWVGVGEGEVGESEQDKARWGALERALIAQTGVGGHVADGTCHPQHVKVDLGIVRRLTSLATCSLGGVSG